MKFKVWKNCNNNLFYRFILSPISPAVVVPTLLSLKEKGYGEDKGIATLVIAASSIDDILSISVFGVIMSAIFNPGSEYYIIIIHLNQYLQHIKESL